RFTSEIPQRQLDARHRLLRRAVGGLAHRPVHVEVVLLDRRRVLADEPRAEILHEPDEPARDALAPELAVAREALVGADGAEVPWARRLEPGVDDERLDRGDLHGRDHRASRSRMQRAHPRGSARRTVSPARGEAAVGSDFDFYTSSPPACVLPSGSAKMYRSQSLTPLVNPLVSSPMPSIQSRTLSPDFRK